MTKTIEQPNQKKGGKGLLIILAVLLLGLNAFQFWWYQKQNKANNLVLTEKTNEIEEKNSQINSQLAELDSLTVSFEKIKAEKVALGLDVTSLETQLEKIRKDRNYYARNFIKPSVRKEMQATIENYKNLLLDQEEKIATLTADRDSLFKENTFLKEEMTHINDTIIELEKIQHNQEEQLKVARRLKASEIKITAVKDKEKGKTKYENDQEYKAKDLEQTQIEFVIEPNKLALIEEKPVYVQVLDASKKVIYNNDKGSGVFNVEKYADKTEELIYSMTDNITYQRKKISKKFIFENPAKYTAGKYYVRIWCEDAIIGSSSFTVK